MPTVSLCMIVKNEERTLGRVLACASSFCDEIIVVDTGSTDRTVEIARQYGAKVGHFTWCDDFAAARNYSFSLATGDWILWLDADDVLPEQAIAVAHDIKANLLPTTQADAVFLPYNYAYDAEGRCIMTQTRERFLRRSAGPVWAGKIHETCQTPSGTWARCDQMVVEHRTAEENAPRKEGRNLRIFEQYIDLKTATLRELFLYGGELQASGRLRDAGEAYETYLQRYPVGMRDHHDEKYTVMVKLAECYRGADMLDQAMARAVQGVLWAGDRAECYGILGMCHYSAGNIRAAFPAFLAAAACKKPTHGGLVFDAFYSEAIHDMIKECKTQLETVK